MLVVILHWPPGTETEPWCLDPPPFPLSGWTLFLQGSLMGAYCNHGLYCGQQPPIRGIFSGKNIGVGSHFLLQGIFLTQGSNPCLLNWQADSLSLSNQEAQLALC